MTNRAGRANFKALYERLLRELAQGHYRPGERVGVKDLSIRLQVSETPMREILSRLVGRGVIEERRAEGYYLVSLDAARIADLYRIHAVCLDIALRGKALTTRPPRSKTQDIWTVFDELVEASGNAILLDIRRYIADRLNLLRRCEILVFDDLETESVFLQALLGAGDRIACRKFVQEFHNRRIKLAARLSFLLEHSL